MDGGIPAIRALPQPGAPPCSLPPIHKDPFDRMLVAQSHVEKLTLVTRDKLLVGYDIPILAA